MQNPGFLRVKFLNLRERRAQLVNCPTRDKKSKSKSKSGGKVSFTYRLGHVTVNMETGEIRIKKVRNRDYESSGWKTQKVISCQTDCPRCHPNDLLPGSSVRKSTKDPAIFLRRVRVSRPPWRWVWVCRCCSCCATRGLVVPRCSTPDLRLPTKVDLAYLCVIEC